MKLWIIDHPSPFGWYPKGHPFDELVFTARTVWILTVLKADNDIRWKVRGCCKFEGFLPLAYLQMSIIIPKCPERITPKLLPAIGG
jgi:hypothetical protein